MKKEVSTNVYRLLKLVLANRKIVSGPLNGFKPKKGTIVSSICECGDDGGDGCSE